MVYNDRKRTPDAHFHRRLGKHVLAMPDRQYSALPRFVHNIRLHLHGLNV